MVAAVDLSPAVVAALASVNVAAALAASASGSSRRIYITITSFGVRLYSRLARLPSSVSTVGCDRNGTSVVSLPLPLPLPVPLPLPPSLSLDRDDCPRCRRNRRDRTSDSIRNADSQCRSRHTPATTATCYCHCCCCCVRIRAIVRIERSLLLLHMQYRVFITVCLFNSHLLINLLLFGVCGNNSLHR